MKSTATGNATGLLDDMSIHHMPGQLMRRLRQLAKRLFAEEIVGPFDPYQRRRIRCGTRIMLGSREMGRICYAKGIERSVQRAVAQPHPRALRRRIRRALLVEGRPLPGRLNLQGARR